MEEKFLKVMEEFKNETAKECYEIKIEETTPSILDDKLGGKPYLPIGEEYPKDKDGNNMPLLLQVNLNKIDLKGFPKKGILEIFTDKDVDYPCQYAIRYFEEGLEYQTDIPDVDTKYYIIPEPLKISLSKTVDYMRFSDYRFLDTMIPIVNKIYGIDLKNSNDMDNFFEKYDWYEAFDKNIPQINANIGGYPDFTQNDPRDNMVEKKEECLFKLDSYLDERIMIGDMGILFVLISQSDLESCNFEKALVDWDCC